MDVKDFKKILKEKKIKSIHLNVIEDFVEKTNTVSFIKVDEVYLGNKIILKIKEMKDGKYVGEKTLSLKLSDFVKTEESENKITLTKIGCYEYNNGELILKDDIEIEIIFE